MTPRLGAMVDALSLPFCLRFLTHDPCGRSGRGLHTSAQHCVDPSICSLVVLLHMLLLSSESSV